MIEELTNLPDNVVGFKANGIVTKEDFQKTVLPSVKRMIKKNGYLNYLFVLESEFPEYTAGAWLQDAWLGVSHITKWNRAAIVSYSGEIIGLTDLFSHITPGEFRGFHYNNMDHAIQWAAQAKINYTDNFFGTIAEVLYLPEIKSKIVNCSQFLKINTAMLLANSNTQINRFITYKKDQFNNLIHNISKNNLNKVYRLLHVEGVDSNITRSNWVYPGRSKRIPAFYHKVETTLKNFIQKQDHDKKIPDEKSKNSKVLSGLENSQI